MPAIHDESLHLDSLAASEAESLPLPSPPPQPKSATAATTSAIHPVDRATERLQDQSFGRAEFSRFPLPCKGEREGLGSGSDADLLHLRRFGKRQRQRQ